MGTESKNTKPCGAERMKMSELIQHAQRCIATEGDLPVVMTVAGGKEFDFAGFYAADKEIMLVDDETLDGIQNAYEVGVEG